MLGLQKIYTILRSMSIMLVTNILLVRIAKRKYPASIENYPCGTVIFNSPFSIFNFRNFQFSIYYGVT